MDYQRHRTIEQVPDNVQYAPPAEEDLQATLGNQALLEQMAQQQQAPAAAPPKAADAFHGAYKHRSGEVYADRGKSISYESYKSKLGPTRASSESTGKLLPYQQRAAPAQAVTAPLTEAELLAIFGRGPADPDNAQVLAQLPAVNQAFRIMKLDTVGAQAAYLANAALESDQFRHMTETTKAAGGTPFEQDPTQAPLDEGWLNRAAAGQVKGVAGYEQGGSINKNGNWNESFIGRGPLQVTHDYVYVQTLAVLEKRAEELAALPEGSAEKADLAIVKEALAAIKADPQQAANPRYAYLFSAAMMKRPKDLGDPSKTADLSASGGSATAFMGPQPDEPKRKKDEVYNRAVKVLSAREKAAPAP